MNNQTQNAASPAAPTLDEQRVQEVVGIVVKGVVQIVQQCAAALNANTPSPGASGSGLGALLPVLGKLFAQSAGTPPAATVDAPAATVSDSGLKVPTFNELIEAYKSAAAINYKKNFKPCPRAVRGVVYGVQYNCKLLKIPLDHPITEITYERINELEDIGLTMGKSRATIQGWRGHLKSVTASWAIPMYRRMGYDVKPYETSQFTSATEAYKALPKETVRKIDDWIEHLDDDRHHRDEKCFVWIMRNLGVRNGDVFRFTWGNFTEKDGGKIHSSYVPNKTSKNSQRRANWDLPKEKWMEIGKYKPVDATDETPVINVGEKVRDRFQHDLNIELKKILPPGRNKGLYELRKLASQEVYVKYGKKMAVKFSGDSFDTLEKNYVDTSMDNED